VSKLAKNARNALIAEAALAFARDRLGAKVPGAKPRKRRGRKLLVGGLFAVLGAGLFMKRDKVAALLPGGQPQEAAPPPPPPPPAPSNYDVAGPVANTATPVPAPDPQVPEAIDEPAEEAAAAAEAANIGGPQPDYTGAAEPGQPEPEAERPLAEAGEGEAEGQEQAEADLAAAAEPTAPGVSPAQQQLDEAIEAAGNPAVGETAEAAEPASPEESPSEDERPGQSEWRTWSGRSINP
jgi:hypothetical protein